MPVPVAEISQSQAAIVVSQEQPLAVPAAPPPPVAAVQPAAPLPAAAANNAGGADVEAGVKAGAKCKRKTTQNDQSHGSFFLRIGAIGKSGKACEGEVVDVASTQYVVCTNTKPYLKIDWQIL